MILDRPLPSVASTRPPRRALTLRLSDYLALHRQRRALARLDAAALRDLGIDVDAARREATRPVWDVPQSWLR